MFSRVNRRRDGLRLRRAQPERGDVLDHLVILLADQLPVDRAREDGGEVGIRAGLAGIGPVQALLADALEPRQELEAQELRER